MLDNAPGLSTDEIKRRIAKALARDGSHTFDDLMEKVHDGRAQMFFNDWGVWVTEILTAPQKRVLNVWVIAGQMPEVMELQDKVLQFARDNACVELVTICRKGWLAHLDTYNWKNEAVVLRRTVEGP